MDAQDPVLDALIDRVHRARSRRTPLEIRGGGTKAFYGGPARGEPLEMSGLAGISLYEPTELVVTARAGTPLDKVWASGLRYPRRFSFDRLTGDLYIGDVGQTAREEIDFQARASRGGENYGWGVMEASLCRGAAVSGCPAGVPPLPARE